MINPRSSSKEESPLLVMGQSPVLAWTRADHFFRAQALARLGFDFLEMAWARPETFKARDQPGLNILGLDPSLAAARSSSTYFGLKSRIT